MAGDPGAFLTCSFVGEPHGGLLFSFAVFLESRAEFCPEGFFPSALVGLVCIGALGVRSVWGVWGSVCPRVGDAGPSALSSWLTSLWSVFSPQPYLVICVPGHPRRLPEAWGSLSTGVQASGCRGVGGGGPRCSWQGCGLRGKEPPGVGQRETEIRVWFPALWGDGAGDWVGARYL